MRLVVAASVGVVLAGPVGGLLAGLTPFLWNRLLATRRAPDPSMNLVLLLLLVHLRSGLSVLAAINEVSGAIPRYESLRRVARVARVSGLVASIPYADDALRPVVAHLARAQRSGASLGGAVRRMLETSLAADRSQRIAKARTLPVRLMIPVTLLMLPGLILLLYAPSLLGMFGDLTGVLS